MKSKLLLFGYLLGIFAYFIFSFTQVDPNLVLSSNPLYLQIQKQLWELGLIKRTYLSVFYLITISVLFACYAGIVWQLKHNTITESYLTKLLIAVICILLASYPALSHDIFNYIFNTKIVLKYHQNPHIKVALDYPLEPMLLYMHNTHTPAPYAYGWTIISLIPGLFVSNNIKQNILIFKLFILCFLAILFFYLKKRSLNKWQWWLFALNPLLLIETIGNSHNDVVMMAIFLMGFVYSNKNKVIGFILGFLSTTIKYATFLLLPSLWNKEWLFLGQIGLMLLLLTSRSQQFLPWYLIWAMSLIPLIKFNRVTEYIILLSFTALLSYLPFLFLGEYNNTQQWLRKIITFFPPTIYFITNYLENRLWIKRNS